MTAGLVGGRDMRRDSDWSALRIVVVGIGIAGFACADQLAHRGARVTVVDGGQGQDREERAEVLRTIGVEVVLGAAPDHLPECDVLVVSPGLPPHAPIIAAAVRRDVPVWGELEVAWRLRPTVGAAPWLLVTGTNGKTTTTLMLESMLRADGRATLAAGNIGVSLVDVTANEGVHHDLDVIAVEVGAPQLPFVHSVSPEAAVCLNLAEDHIDHFASFEAYRAAKARIYERTRVAAIYNDADPATIDMVERADVIEGCRAIGFTLGTPARSMLGLVDDVLVDRAFLADRSQALELATLADVEPAAPHQVANALAAAALARAVDVTPRAVRQGLRDFSPAPHRIATVAEIDGVRYVDDSKATNAHAAETSLLAYERVVWIAGGLAKGQAFDELVRRVAGRLRAAVLLGQDRELIAEALARHAPDVPVAQVAASDTGAMDEVVARAAEFAVPGDVVLLAPGCASWDMFTDYAARGEAFAAAVRSRRS